MSAAPAADTRHRRSNGPIPKANIRMLIFGETHLRRILSAYAAYYNQTRTHLHHRKMRLCIEQSNGPVSLSPFPSCRTASSIRPDMISERTAKLG
jgi:hypothetical protein